MITMTMMMRRRRGFGVCQVYCSFVSSYCVILLPKPDSQRTHTTSAQGLGENFTFLFICSHDFLSPFSKVFYSVGQVERNNKKKSQNCHVKQLQKVSAVMKMYFLFEPICYCMLQIAPHDKIVYMNFTRKAKINIKNRNFHNYFTWNEPNVWLKHFLLPLTKHQCVLLQR